MPEVSVVVRTLNEKNRLKEILDSIKNQDFSGQIELIIVDNESTDGTVDVASEYGAKLITIRKDEFSFPRSMNVGTAAATSEIVILTVGHALPLARSWLTTGVRHFADPQVAGVYSPNIARKDGTWFEKIFYLKGYLKAKLSGPVAVQNAPGMGIMGATNCAIRRSLWLKHSFDESYGLGGEDGEWAGRAISRGYKIIRDAGFAVRHSHGLGFRDFMKQIKYWRSLSKPQPFDRRKIAYRKDLKF